jgi:hypothetical protein
MTKPFQKNLRILAGAALLAVAQATQAADFTFDTDPFAGTTALTTPGRQVIAGETFINFNIATDRILLGGAAFGVDSLNFVNDVVPNIPTTGVNLVVNQTFDNDGNPGTAFGAGNAATLIADQITSAGPGFFVYFNSNLDLPRLVFSTDLSDPTADLKVLFRFVNLNGQAGRDAVPTFTAANFSLAPDSGSSLGLLTLAGGALLVLSARTRRTC